MFLRWIKSTRRLKRILVLWALLLFQLCLIAIFVGFGATNNDNDIEDEMTRVDVGIIQLVTDEKNDISLANSESATATTAINIDKILLTSIGDFHREFVNCYKQITIDAFNDTAPFYCFRNGSIEPSQIFNENDIDNQDCTCKCQPKYHGKDCGQPEVVWRAFMVARLSRKDVGHETTAAQLSDRMSVFKPPRIFYMIEATAFSLSTIEMQFMELNELVDLFIFCDEISILNNSDANTITTKDRLLSYHQSSYQHSNDFFLKRFKHKILIVQTMDKCSPKLMYKHLQQAINTMSKTNNEHNLIQSYTDDILLYSRADEILNRQAVAYLKWYNDWSQAQPIRFRLKHTVYGFYWQHPDHTVLASVATQLHVLDEIYGSDPKRLTMDNTIGMIIGDLNHFGGWYCQYCYESPFNIVQKLEADKDLNVFDPITMDDEQQQRRQQQQFPHQRFFDKVIIHKKPAVVDSNYVQSLISAGLFVDRRTNLLRLHRFSDKYYAPDSVCDKNWKYQSMLTNMYAHYDNDIDDEE